MASRTRTRIIILLLCGLCGFGGAATAIVFQRQIKSLATRAYLRVTTPQYAGENELLRDVFTGELVERERLVNPPCQSVDDVARQVGELFMDAGAFPTAYATLQAGAGQTQAPLFKLPYALGRDYTAYAYFKPCTGPVAADRPAGGAILIIPGTGANQSSEIFRNSPGNYHGDVAAMAARHGDVYILVKPNEDFLAIHNGRGKLADNCIINYLLNKGGAYTARYIVDALALTKHLQARYGKVLVVGLSQGGTATLLVALQARPTGAVIASGFSVLNEKLDQSNHDQIIIPGVWTHWTNERIRQDIAGSPTRYLFTFGKAELGSYRIEAEDGLTAKLLSGAANVTCQAHEGGHEFPEPLVENFITSIAQSAAPPAPRN